MRSGGDKHEGSFKRILSKLTVDDVVAAVRRAEALSRKAGEYGFRKAQHKGYEYYLDNPVTELWVPVKEMLVDSGLLSA